MRKIIVYILLLLGITTHILSEEIDLDKVEGTDQQIISSLYPKPASVTVDENCTIKAIFNTALQPKPISVQEVKLTKLEEESSNGIFSMFKHKKSKNKTIDGKISYSTDKKSILFKSNQPLEIGYYEVEFRRLTPKFNPTTMPMDYKRIKTIKYRFYVPEIINGHMLPPEPDKTKNNSTLLGIDRNENEIRDDVERYIVKRFAQVAEFPKTKTAIALQYAWASQKILENPTMDSSQYNDDVLACQSYWFDNKTKNMTGFETMKYMSKHSVFNDPKIKDKIYNTRERIEQKFSYNSVLSGNILEDNREDTIDRCRTNIDGLGE